MNEKKSLVKNTIMLYILMFSGYLFALISVPYVTRILGPEYYGKIGFSQSIMNYVRLIVDFGFILSATEVISKNRKNLDKLSSVLTSVVMSKLILSMLSFIFLVVFIAFSPKLREDSLLYILTFLSVVSASFLPDFLYRGLEKMEIITIRTVAIQFLSLIMTFLFLKEQSDYYMVPLFTLIGNLIAIIIIYIDVNKNLGIKFSRVNVKDIKCTLKNSSSFFLSRIAGTIYSSTNLVVLGIVYPISSPIIGYFTAVDKLVTTAKAGFTPIADSLYPYMINKKDYRLLKRILLILLPVTFIGCALMFIFSKEIILLLFGKQFLGAIKIFKYMIPIIFITPFSYLLGFPTLSPLGLAKYANKSTIYASLIQVTLLFFIVVFNKFNIYNLCTITIISEYFIVIYRLVIINKYKKRG